MMTRKDFVLIAEAMRAKRHPNPISDVSVAYNTALDDAARALAYSLAGTNPNFKRERFLTACGVVS
jgi:hypothetical protein